VCVYIHILYGTGTIRICICIVALNDESEMRKTERERERVSVVHRKTQWVHCFSDFDACRCRWKKTVKT